MKKLLFALMFSLLGCAMSSRLNRVSLGMTKEDVLATMGTPNSTSAEGNYEYMVYKLTEWRAGTAPEPQRYVVRLVDGKVQAYGKEGDLDLGKDQTYNVNVNRK